MVTNRLSREFGDEVARLMGTRRGMASEVGVELQVLLAVQTSREAVDKAGEYILRRPVRVASVLSATPDPLVLAALAGDRAMRNLAGLDATGTDGQDLDYATSLETMAARAARDHVIRCQRDPVAARELEAGWVANRSAIRSSFLRESVEAMEATYGTACAALTDRADGRRPLVAPPPTWAAQGVMASVAPPFPPGFQQSFGNVLMTSAPPQKWMPREGRAYEGWDRVRTRFIAKGGIGRAEQLARRSLIRVPASRMMMRSRLTANLNRGPEAAKHFVQRAASHPRRAAALLSMPIDPMVVAAALGPQAMAAVLEGRRVPIESQAARLCDAMVRADRERVAVAMASGNPDKAMAELRQAGDLGDGAHSFVDRAWKRSVPDGPDPRSTPLGLSRSGAPGVEEVWQKARVGAISPADISPDFRAQMQAAAVNEPGDIDLSAWDDFDDRPPGSDSNPDPSEPAPLYISWVDVLVQVKNGPSSALDGLNELDQTLVAQYAADVMAERLGAEFPEPFTGAVGSDSYWATRSDFSNAERDRFKSLAGPIVDSQFRNILEHTISSRDVLSQLSGTVMPDSRVVKAQVSPDENQRNLTAAVERLVGPHTLESFEVGRVAKRPIEAVVLVDLAAAELARKLRVECAPRPVVPSTEKEMASLSSDPLVLARLRPVALELARVSFERTITFVEKALPGAQPERAPERTQERSERVDRSDGRTDRAPESPDRSPDRSAPAPDLSFDHVDALRVGARDVREVACGFPPNTFSFSRDHFSPQDNALDLSEAVRRVLAEDLLQADPVYKDVHDPVEKEFVVHLTGARLAQRLAVKLPSGGISSPDSALNAAIAARLKDDAVLERLGPVSKLIAQRLMEKTVLAVEAVGEREVFRSPGQGNPDREGPGPDRSGRDSQAPDPAPVGPDGRSSGTDVPVVPPGGTPVVLDPDAEIFQGEVSGNDPARVSGPPPPIETSWEELRSGDIVPPIPSMPGAPPFIDTSLDDIVQQGRRPVTPSPSHVPIQSYIDIPKESLSDPSPGPNQRHKATKDVAPEIPGPEIVSAGNGRWDVKDDPLVSHLEELPDGGYRVHFHADADPAAANRDVAVAMASSAHSQLLDMANEPQKPSPHSDLVNDDLARRLSDQMLNANSGMDAEDRDEPGASVEPLLVSTSNSFDPDVPTSVVPEGVSGASLRAWVQDHLPEMDSGFTPEFATQAEIEHAGGRLKPDAEPVRIEETFSRPVQPFSADTGKIDPEAKPVTISGSKLVPVYHVGTQLTQDSAAAVLKLRGSKELGPRYQPSPQLQGQPVTPVDIVRASGVRVVEKGNALARFAVKGDTPFINIGRQGGPGTDLGNPDANRRLLSAAVNAHVSQKASAVAKEFPAGSSRTLLLHMATERLASKLGAPYKPVPLNPGQREKFAEILKDPKQASRIVRTADAVVKDLVEPAVKRVQGRDPQRPPRGQAPASLDSPVVRPTASPESDDKSRNLDRS